MAAPTMTLNAAGNIRSSASLAAGANSTSSTFNVSTKFAAQIQIGATFGTLAATNGLQIDIFRVIGSTPVVDNIPIVSFVMAGVASTARALSVELSTGQYQIKFTNLDATNGLTLVYATADTIDTVA
jgi:hypothetical protein